VSPGDVVPIYEYRCSHCGHQQDHLQKVSDPVLTTCPACGAETYSKQVTAAGFQLKGSGWYATDFKGGSRKPPAKEDAGTKTESKPEAKADSKPDAKAETKSDAKSDTKSESKPAAKAAASADGGS
jgi:putative FmdB family regulatory protein